MKAKVDSETEVKSFRRAQTPPGRLPVREDSRDLGSSRPPQKKKSERRGNQGGRL